MPIFIYNKIPLTLLPDVDSVEALFCKLLFTTHVVVLERVYHAPSSSPDCMDALRTYMRRHASGARVILVGILICLISTGNSYSTIAPAETLFTT